MAELTFYFEAPAGADLQGEADRLQKELARTARVESVETMALRTQSVGPPEIAAMMKIAIDTLKNATEVATALLAFIEVAKKVSASLGLKNLCIEIMSRKVPVDQLTPDHLRELAGEQGKSAASDGSE